MKKNIENTKTYYDKNKKEILKTLKKKYITDEEFRNKIKERYRKRYQDDETYRIATIERAKENYRKKKERELLEEISVDMVTAV
jgi:mannitol-1-phosphate/altronate dehydrogenase